MKRLMKAMTLLLAALMLFASCTPDTPEPPAPPAPPVPEKPAEPDYLPPEELAIPDEINFAQPKRLTEVDPAKPYNAIHTGLFDNQMYTSTTTPRGGDMVGVTTTSRYSIFIPENGQPKLPCVLVLTPNNTTAAQFARTDIGIEWIKAANEGGFAVAFAEPYMGKKWNVKLEAPTEENGLRDEKAFAVDLFASVRTKKITDNAFLNVDKNGFSIVGYKEGATMAAVLAAAWPQEFANCFAIDPVGFNSSMVDFVENMLNLPTYPHNSEWSASSNYGNITAGEIAMPMYVIKGEDEVKITPPSRYNPVEKKETWNSGDNIQKIWEGVNENAVAEDTSAAKEFYVSKFLDADTTVSELGKLAIANVRPRGYAGGTLRARTDMWNDKGYEMNEKALCKDAGDDRVHRWATYTPESVTAESKNVPLVVVLHGSTAAINDIVDESKWSDVADKNGFIVLYCQGYPGGTGKGTDSTHAPSWTFGQDDINFILSAVKDTQAKHTNIDASKIYLTGHSLGAMMTNTIMNDEKASKVFAAYAPIGAFSAPQEKAGTDWYGNPTLPTPKTEMPVYGLMGEWEFRGANGSGLKWAKRFGIEKMPKAEFLEGYTDGKYKTWSFTDKNGVTPVKITQVIDSPHVYMAEESEIVWDWCKDFSRDLTTGKSLYKGNPVIPVPEKAEGEGTAPADK